MEFCRSATRLYSTRFAVYSTCFLLILNIAMASELDNIKFDELLVRRGLLPAYVLSLNFSLPKETLQPFCDFVMTNKTNDLEQSNITFCPPVYDGFLCWAPAKADSRPSRKCPIMVSIDASQFAYRYCGKNGVWDNKTNYDYCLQPDVFLSAIFFTGYSLSLISLTVSLGIFLYFKSLRCLRNHIHSNLIISFLIRSLAYFAYYVYASHRAGQTAICNILHFISSFAMLANHIWMVMEGLYLFLIILCTFSIEKLKFWHFGLMGWGLSGLLSGTYSIVMAAYYPNKCSSEPTHLEWIINGPIIGSLVVNTLFLIFILYSLVIKVKASQRYRPTATITTAGEATLATEYRKALKAMLVLFPLLGIGYILFLIPPHSSPELTKIYNYIDAVMLSTQGFFVALIYCFLNSEVRSVVRTHYNHWDQTRSIFRQRQCSLPVGGAAVNNRRNSRSANYFLSADHRRSSPDHRSLSVASARSFGAHSYNGTGDCLLVKPVGRRQRLFGSHSDQMSKADHSEDEQQQQETALCQAEPSDQPNGLSVPSVGPRMEQARRNGATE